MSNGKENPIIINYKDYPQRKNSSPLLQNIPKKLYFRKHLSFEKLNENENIIKKPKKSIFYYKNPKFFNEMNINTQLNFLRKLSYENKMKDEYTQKYDSLSDKNLFPKLKRNNTESLDVLAFPQVLLTVQPSLALYDKAVCLTLPLLDDDGV